MARPLPPGWTTEHYSEDDPSPSSHKALAAQNIRYAFLAGFENAKEARVFRADGDGEWYLWLVPTLNERAHAWVLIRTG